jgi:AmmeMemoRadiSam system protein B
MMKLKEVITMDRRSSEAGSWYAGTASSLKQQIHDSFLNEWGYGKDPLDHPQDRSSDPNLLGIVSPHAGYIYSGPIASHGYAEVFKRVESLKTVVLLGTNHRGQGAPISFYPAGLWHTPLGSVSINEDFMGYAKNYDFGGGRSRIGFEESAHTNEHSIGIQLPFLQYLYNNQFQIAPICMADQSYHLAVPMLSTFLEKYILSHPNERILIVASSDFSHENKHDISVNNDKKMLSFLENMELDEAEDFRQEKPVTMCGYGPVFTLLKTAQKLGKPTVNILKYATNIDTNPSPSGGGYTVGYASILVKYQ